MAYAEPCSKCNKPGHIPTECPERRLSKLWPGQYVFRGKFRTPEGSTVELEMPLGDRGQEILTEFIQIAIPKD